MPYRVKVHLGTGDPCRSHATASRACLLRSLIKSLSLLLLLHRPRQKPPAAEPRAGARECDARAAQGGGTRGGGSGLQGKGNCVSRNKGGYLGLPHLKWSPVVRSYCCIPMFIGIRTLMGGEVTGDRLRATRPAEAYG